MFRRWIIRTLFMLPLLLCLAGWLWSSTHFTRVGYGYGTRGVFLGTRAGALQFHYSVGSAEPGWTSYNQAFFPPEFWPSRESPKQKWFLGLSYIHIDLTRVVPGLHLHFFTIPYWFLIVLFSVVLLFVWRKTRPAKAGKAFPVEISKNPPP